MKIIFSMPKSFVRTKGRTNPFFDPILDVCKNNNLDWYVLVPCRKSEIGYDSDRVIDGRRFDSLGIWFWRVVHVLCPKMSVGKVYTLYGELYGKFTGSKYKADLIVTIGGQFAEQLTGINPHARFAGLQHGVIYSKHDGYFHPDGRAKFSNDRNSEMWLYGQGYADCYAKNPSNKQWLNCVKVIGDVVRAGSQGEGVAVDIGVEGCGQRKLAVIASQMTTDFDVETLAKMKDIYERFMDGLKGAKGVRVVFRHHPRFGNAVDLSDWKSRYDWVDFGGKRPWNEVYAEALCVVTINSTCAFDAAAQGVPTVLLDGTSLGWNNLMVDEYDYPLRDLSVNEILALSEKDWSGVRDRLKKWYNTYYTPFSPERALRLLKGEI